MKESLEKIVRHGDCGMVKCAECPFDKLCTEADCAFPYALLTWAAKGMLYEMEASSRRIFEWLHDLYAEVNQEITVTFDHFNCIDGLRVTLVEVDNNILYFDVNGKDVRVEKHMCTEPFAKEQLLLTDVINASYTVVSNKPTIGG